MKSSPGMRTQIVNYKNSPHPAASAAAHHSNKIMPLAEKDDLYNFFFFGWTSEVTPTVRRPYTGTPSHATRKNRRNKKFKRAHAPRFIFLKARETQEPESL